MKILVAYASRHGATQGIAEAIAGELRDRGLDTDFKDAGQVGDIEGYEAIVLGSALYAGRWESNAVRFIEANRAKLATIPIWLFSSGPLGAGDPKPFPEGSQLSVLKQSLHPRGDRTFAGRLDTSHLNLLERLMTKVVRGPVGDFRDWQAIRKWAREIASQLAPNDLAKDG